MSRGEWTRRTMIGAGLSIAAAGVIGSASDAETIKAGQRPPKTGGGRIDVHQHVLPPEFVAALERHGMGGWAPVKWDLGATLAVMDEHQIATGMLSLAAPGPFMGDAAEARLLTRQVNERIAGLVKDRPDRFGLLASVPLPDVDGALEAIRHAYDDLSADGVILMANTRGTYLGDPAFDPVMEELNRRKAVVLVHPSPLPGAPVAGIHPAIADFLLDTTRASVNLAIHGVPRRYPDIRIILAHAGGFLPYAAYRIATQTSEINPKIDATAMLADLSTFYFDTALSGSPTVLPSLGAFARPGHILYGTDWPYAPDKTIAFYTDGLDAYKGFGKVEHQSIDRTNAEALFPRLAHRRVAASQPSMAAGLA